MLDEVAGFRVLDAESRELFASVGRDSTRETGPTGAAPETCCGVAALEIGEL